MAVSSTSSGTGIGINDGFQNLAPSLKLVESTASFQKIRTALSKQTLQNDGLRYTYCDAKDFSVRPFGNLFQSFRLPTSPADRAVLRRNLSGTALAAIAEVDKFIMIEIPRNKYGELVDGKSIELTIPQKSGSAFTVANCFGTFYNFNPTLNNQVSDANAISSLFSGVEPTENNDYNTNIAYLFSNDVKRPLDNFTSYDASGAETISLPVGTTYSMTTLKGPLLPGKTYQSTSLNQLRSHVTVLAQTALGNIAFTDVLEYDSPGAFRVKYTVTNILFANQTNADYSGFIGISELRPISAGNWSSWSPQNRFPAGPNGSGKVYAKLNDANYGLLQDEPVGIAYLDKGFILITNPTLVANFDLSEALTTDINGVVSPYSQAVADATLFTNVFFPAISSTGANRSSLGYRSIITEYNQGYTCLAMPDEFTQTTNPTYQQAYPAGTGNVGQQPILITEIGLYNKYGELIAIAKTTKPLEKTKTSVAVFNIGLKI